MKHWTETAESRLEEYLRHRADREGLHGEDADELRSDLRRHIYEDAENDASVTSVGLMQLEKILSKLDAGYKLPCPILPGTKNQQKHTVLLWIFGVILPAIVVAAERTLSMCASEIFDPIPTWWHFLLILLVPVSNALLLSKKAQNQRQIRKCNPVLAGCALGVSLFYSFIFLPMIVVGCVGLIFFLIGLLPLSPQFALISSWRIAKRVNQEGGRTYRRVSRITAISVMALLIGAEVPGAWTRHQLQNASSTDAEISQPAITKLRKWHSQKTLLTACYAPPWGRQNYEIGSWVTNGWLPMLFFSSPNKASRNPQIARSVFFQVTGENYNSFPSPLTKKQNYRESQRRFSAEDWDHGGDTVAGRTANLDLQESRYDGHLDQQTGISYGEWTMVFHNSSDLPREARCQFRVPAGGKVSRLTLWINGEPCEAAFGTVSKVKAAYKEVAVVYRRDPVLVNLVGPDTYMMQCYPVPVDGDMKIRIGITSTIEENRSQLPYILEKNFDLAPQLSHAIWLQSKHPFKINSPATSSHADADGQSLQIDSPEMGLSLECQGENLRPETIWCRDPFIAEENQSEPKNNILTATKASITESAIKKWIVVVDGSTAMKEHAAMISRGLDGIPAEVIFSGEDTLELQPGELTIQRYRGGFDNEPAIYTALQRARNQPESAILWFHAAQAVELTKKERIFQLLERGTTNIPFYAATLSPGSNRLLEAIGRKGSVKILPLHITKHDGLRAWMQEKMQAQQKMKWTFTHGNEVPAAPAMETDDQLARFWAMEQVEKTSDAPLAARYQLVTHVSGAVVLENADQYARHGLTQVDASTVAQIANIPEPSSCLLLLTTAMALMMRRRVVP